MVIESGKCRHAPPCVAASGPFAIGARLNPAVREVLKAREFASNNRQSGVKKLAAGTQLALARIGAWAEKSSC